jgi:two-component system sensor histidine kinase/response regulator
MDVAECQKINLMDMAQLEEFTEGDMEEEAMLLDVMNDVMAEAIEELQQHVNSGDDEAWRKAAHKLKGAAGNFGATRMYELCAAAEHECRGDDGRKNGFMAAIISCSKEISSYFAQRHQAHSA